MRPGNAVAPAPEVGVVDATIADRPRQQAHAGSLPLCLAGDQTPPGGAQGGSSVPSPLLRRDEPPCRVVPVGTLLRPT